MEEFDELARVAGEQLCRRHWLLVTAESCTGGWVAQAMTAVPGSSDWFDRGFVTYSNRAKEEMLGVPRRTLEQHGAVSEATVRDMVMGALNHSAAQVAIAVSGIAGPGGGSVAKPVGTVWIAWGARGVAVKAKGFHFAGDRQAVRRAAVAAALHGLFDYVGSLTVPV